MILLRNFDYANKYFDYESKLEKENDQNPKINGWYKFIGEILVALLVLDNKLYFLYDSDKYLVNDNFRVVLNKKNKLNDFVFDLFNGEIKLVSYLYNQPDQKQNIAPFDYIDDEDFKWEKFVETVINSKNRQNNFISNLME